MSLTHTKVAAGSALLAGLLALGPSFAAAQTSSVTPLAKTTPAPALPAANDASPAPKWVREPIGGPKSDKFLRVADARGLGTEITEILALGASNRAAVILLVQGHNQQIIHDARLSLGLLVLRDGYDRVGLVLGDGTEDVAYIYSKGHKLITVENVVKAEDRVSGFEDGVKRLYERDVLPTLTPQPAVARAPGQ